MTRDLATRPASGAITTAAALKPPTLSPRLASALKDTLDPHPATMGQTIALPVHTRMEAAAAAAKYADLCSPPTLERVMWWLRAINAAVRNPQPEEAFMAWAVTVAGVVCHDIPQATLIPATQREAVQSFAFFPSAADVYKLLRPHAAPLLAAKAALDRLAAAPEEAPSVKPESQAERDAILAKFRADNAALFAADAETAPPAPPPAAVPFNGLTGAALASARAKNPLVQAAIAMRDRMKGE